MSNNDAEHPRVRLLGPPKKVWKEQALGRAMEIETLLNWFERQSNVENKESLVQAVRDHLALAREGAGPRPLFVIGNGPSIERTAANLDAARINLLRLAPPEYLLGNMLNLMAEAGQQLPSNDPRLRQLVLLAHRFEVEEEKPELAEPDRNAIVAVIEVAAEEGRRSQTRLRTFRSVIYFTTIVLLFLAAGAAFIGLSRPSLLPLCFLPEQDMVVCPTGLRELDVGTGVNPTASDIDDVTRELAAPGDILVVEILGLFGAAVASTAAIRGMRGSADPYSLPVALAVLKLPLGMLTAFLGLTFIRAQFVPGLSALDSSAQIMAWALVLGYAQQIFTRLVDRQAASIIEETEQTNSLARQERGVADLRRRG
jgi:hypothetical protein